ncbi:BgTH12-02872 [Blumeria graminis f. sp. triticale]|uniref:BgTH12-02872 n=1 Tax=Blumeria graminis f. sp. triticale TaxID=1689686 RepID=A0A9W4DK37_BLUGR|nr:BgTH12-02872 [Blumeria graminis f. sp. triticale]
MLFEDEMTYTEEHDCTKDVPLPPQEAPCYNVDPHVVETREGRTISDNSKLALLDKGKSRMPNSPLELTEDEEGPIVSLLSLIVESAENSRKRARTEDILNDEHDFKTTPKRSGRAKKGETKIRELREIVGRRGKGPVDYVKLAEEIKVPINLLDLFQIFPDLKTKVGKQVPTTSVNLLDKDKSTPQRSFLAVDADNKAFRIPTIVRIRKDGRHKLIRLPLGASQADQGSDINVCSPALASALSAKIRKLGNRGWNTGLQMMIADGNASQLMEFCKLNIRTQGVRRRVCCFIRPDTHKREDLHLLLGLLSRVGLVGTESRADRRYERTKYG